MWMHLTDVMWHRCNHTSLPLKKSESHCNDPAKYEFAICDVCIANGGANNSRYDGDDDNVLLSCSELWTSTLCDGLCVPHRWIWAETPSGFVEAQKSSHLDPCCDRETKPNSAAGMLGWTLSRAALSVPFCRRLSHQHTLILAELTQINQNRPFLPVLAYVLF